jgi:hypothetical protein
MAMFILRPRAGLPSENSEKSLDSRDVLIN